VNEESMAVWGCCAKKKERKKEKRNISVTKDIFRLNTKS